MIPQANNIVFDIDGTICFDGENISPLLTDAIHTLGDDLNIFFASARHPRDIKHVLPRELSATSVSVGANGAICEKQGEILYKNTISQANVNTIIEILERHHFSYLIDGVRGYYQSDKEHDFFDKISPLGDDEESEISMLKEVGILKFLILSASIEDARDPVLEIDDLSGVSLHHHSDGTFDITASSIDKYSAIDKVYSVGDDFVCFGNDKNDLTLLQNSKYSFQIGEHKELTPYATEQIIGSSEEEYVQAILEALRRLKIRVNTMVRK